MDQSGWDLYWHTSCFIRRGSYHEKNSWVTCMWPICMMKIATLTELVMYMYISVWRIRTLTHWGRVTHICVSKLTIIGSDNGLSPGRRGAIIWTNAEINFSEILIEIFYIFIQENAFENVVWKMAAILSRPQCVNGECRHCNMGSSFLYRPITTARSHYNMLNLPPK